MSLNHSPKIVTNGLILYLDAGNVKSYTGSGTTWTDLSGTGNNGTLVGGPTYTTDNGGRFAFDGVNDNVTLSPSALPAGNQITFCVWNFGTTAKNSSIVYFENASAIRTLNVHLPYSDSIIYFDSGNGTVALAYDRISKSAAGLFAGWNYWCFTKNATSGVMNIYRNGTLWHTGSGLTRPVGTSVGTGYIGSGGGAGAYHVGNISNCKLYNRELSADEIQQNFNALRGRFGV